jgi:hypothetical protein
MVSWRRQGKPEGKSLLPPEAGAGAGLDNRWLAGATNKSIINPNYPDCDKIREII